MPLYQIFIDSKPKKVELTRIGEKCFVLKVDGKQLSVEMENKLDFGKLFPIKVNDKKYNVEMTQIDREKPFQIKVEEVAFKVELKPGITTTSKSLQPPQLTQPTLIRKGVTQKQMVEGAVTAPMSGKVISVKVKKGDAVKSGQVLCIIEAMKMENEITAPKSGVVREVNVLDGASVSEGDVLFILD